MTTAAAMAYLYLSEFVLAPYFPKGSLGSVPFDPDSPLFLFDLTAGLVLVGFSEEIVCRGLALSTLRDRLPIPAVYVVSALLFSLMHWSLSTHNPGGRLCLRTHLRARHPGHRAPSGPPPWSISW